MHMLKMALICVSILVPVTVIQAKSSSRRPPFIKGVFHFPDWPDSYVLLVILKERTTHKRMLFVTDFLVLAIDYSFATF